MWGDKFSPSVVDEQPVTTHHQTIHEITTAGSLLPHNLLQRIQRQRTTITPHLRELLSQPQHDQQQPFARSHALVILSSWHDEHVLAILADVLVRHHDTLEDVYDILDATVPAYGAQAIPMLASILQNPDAPRASRIAVCSTLGLIAHLNPLTLRSISRLLRDMLPHNDTPPPYDYELWSWVVVTLTELRSSTLHSRIDQLFRAGMLDPSICGRPDEIRKSLNDKIYRITFADPITLYTQCGV